MCTLIVLDRVLPGVPLVGAFNRDEYLSRAAAPPALLPPAVDGGLSLVAPQDLEAGGTWMGLNARGLFAGLTNRAAASRDPSHRSRGLLVMDALTKETARKAREWVEGEVRGARYNPFHLLLADGRETHLAFLREGELVTRELEPGLHVITNGDPDDASGTKARWLRKRLQGLPGCASLEGVLEELEKVLRAHAPAGDRLDGICVHGPSFGTRSSGVFALADAQWQFWYAEGPPCTTKHRNYTRLLDELRQTDGSEESGIEENR